MLLSIASLLGHAQNYPVGKTSFAFVDPSRNNRNIACEIYYPAQAAGLNAPFAEGSFAHVVFGHGFLMTVSAYESIASALAENGFVVVLPTTEGGFLPSHTNFARDLAFVANDLIAKSQIPSNFFYERISGKYAIGGHSMGGGCTYLSYQYAETVLPSCFFTFAAAETNPSAIGQMSSIVVPNLLFAGEFDCVTPPSAHQIPMFQSQNEEACKYYVEINGAYHCQFNDSNFTCSLGEGGCPQNGISRQTQLSITLQTLLPWLTLWLEENCDEWSQFTQYLEGNSQVIVDSQCEFQIPENLEILLSGTLPACPGDIVTLEATSQAGSIVWNNGETDPVLWVVEEGIYYYSLNNGFCTAQSESVVINFVEDPGLNIEWNQNPILCPKESLFLSSNQSEGDFLWSDGSTEPFLLVKEAGIYSYTLTLENCLFASESLEILEALPFFSTEIVLETGNTICGEGEAILSADPSITQITWNNGAQQNTIAVAEEGLYFFYTEEDPNCIFYSDTVSITIIENPNAKIGVNGNPILCPGETLQLFAQNPVQWSNGIISSEILVDSSGQFFYSFSLEDCIFHSDTISVVKVTLPENDVEFIGNQPLCEGDTLFISTDLPDHSLVWNTGETSSSLAVTEAGDYWFVSPSENCTFYSDTFAIEVLYRPSLFVESPQGVWLCPDSNLLLQANYPLENLLWNTGDTSKTIRIDQPGLYYYSGQKNECLFFSDSLRIEEVLFPPTEFFYPGEAKRCPGDAFYVEVLGTIETPFWKDSIRADSFFVDSPLSLYYTLEFSGCLYRSDTLQFSYLEDWRIDSISGQKTVTPDDYYEYSVLEYPDLVYSWSIEEPAEIISGQGSNMLSVYIPDFEKEQLQLQTQITDNICKTISLNTWLSKASTNSHPSLSNHWDPVVLSGPNEWIIKDSLLKTGLSTRLFNINGVLMLSDEIREDSVYTLSKAGIPPGIYFLTVRDHKNSLWTIKLLR